MGRDTKRKYKVWETLAITVGACVSLFSVTPVVSTAIYHGGEHGPLSPELDLGLPLIPGMAYALVEVECRSWRRNRPFRPFNFLLKQ